MLSKRYINDGKPTERLNELQIRLRNQVNEKVNSNIYQLESVACCVCGCNNTELLSEKDRYGFKFPVVICMDCGLIYTNPRMNQQSYAAFYNSEYRPLYHGKDYPMEEVFKEGFNRGKQIAKFIRDSGFELVGKRVLDVGCSAGGALAHFRDAYGCEVKGCDFGNDGIKYGIEKYGLELHVGDLHSSINPAWKPEIIIYSHVFEHILDFSEECKFIMEAIDDHGLLYVEVPGVKNIKQYYNWDFLLFLQNAHTYHFSLTTLRNVMNRNGFRLLEGNECVNSLFAKGSDSTEFMNDYDRVIRFLKITDKMRHVGMLSRSLRYCVVLILSKCGITSEMYKALKNIFRRRS